MTRPMPPVVRVEPASACNLRCTHCPTGVVRMRRDVMPAAVFDAVLEQLRPHVPPVRVAVMYHGGEPFLNPRFLDMVGTVKALGVPWIKTVTNGMLLTPELCEAIAVSGLDSIELSIDGTSPELNDHVRVNCDFDHVVDVVRRLVVARDRHESRLEILVTTTQFQTAASFDADVPATTPPHLVDALGEAAGGVGFKPTWALRWPSGEPASGYETRHVARADAPTTCSFLDDTLTIRANGDVVACCYDLTSDVVLGNVLDTPLDEIWTGSRFEALRAGFARGDHVPLCAMCAVVAGPTYLLEPAVPVTIGHRLR